MTIQAIYTLGLEGELLVRYMDELLCNVTQGSIPMAKLSDDIHYKLSGLRPYDKIIFRIPSRSMLPYRLMEHLVHLLNTDVPCYVLYDDDPIRYRVLPVSIFSYNVTAFYAKESLDIDDKLIENFVKTNVKDFHVKSVHVVEICQNEILSEKE